MRPHGITVKTAQPNPVPLVERPHIRRDVGIRLGAVVGHLDFVCLGIQANPSVYQRQDVPLLTSEVIGRPDSTWNSHPSQPAAAGVTHWLHQTDRAD